MENIEYDSTLKNIKIDFNILSMSYIQFRDLSKIQNIEFLFKIYIKFEFILRQTSKNTFLCYDSYKLVLKMFRLNKIYIRIRNLLFVTFFTMFIVTMK